PPPTQISPLSLHDALPISMVAALTDHGHAAEQRQRYAARRDRLRAALTGAGFTVEHSEAGLYLWVTRGEDCWSTVDWFAERGILDRKSTRLNSSHVKISYA